MFSFFTILFSLNGVAQINDTIVLDSVFISNVEKASIDAKKKNGNAIYLSHQSEYALSLKNNEASDLYISEISLFFRKMNWDKANVVFQLWDGENGMPKNRIDEDLKKMPLSAFKRGENRIEFDDKILIPAHSEVFIAIYIDDAIPQGKVKFSCLDTEDILIMRPTYPKNAFWNKLAYPPIMFAAKGVYIQ